MSALKLTLPEVPERFQRPLKWVGYPLFALVVFNLALYASLPRERIEDQLLAATGDFLGAEVKATDFGLTMFTGPGVTAEGVTITARPPPGMPPPVGPDGKPEKPPRILIDDVTVHFGTLPLLRGFTVTSFKGHVAQGSVSGHFSSLPEQGKLDLDVNGVQLKAFPSLAAALGLAGVPLEGLLSAKGDVAAAQNMLAQSDGALELTVNSAQVGDGKAKVNVPGFPGGMTLPLVKLGKIAGTVSITKGRAQLHDLKAHSPDVDIEVVGYIDLTDPASYSMLHLYVTFKVSDALIKREPSVEAMVNMAGANARRPDGYYGLSIAGPVSSPQITPTAIPPPGLNVKPAATTKPALPSSPMPNTAPRPLQALPRPDTPAAVAPLPSPPPNEPPPPTPVVTPSVAPPPPAPVPPPAEAMPPNSVPPGPRLNPALHGIGPAAVAAPPTEDTKSEEAKPADPKPADREQRE